MIVSVHQPNYIPYLGFFDKMIKSDIFVIHDDVQFTKKDFQHRNKIRIDNGWKWLTVPVENKLVNINSIKIINDKTANKSKWSDIHFREIKANYTKTHFFGEYEYKLKKIYETKHDNLIDLNMDFIKLIMEGFDIDKPIIYASDLNLESHSTQKLVDIVKMLGGDTYLSGIGGYNYMDISLFGDINVVFQKFDHPTYKQRYEGFEFNMSSIDALFNLGKFPNIGDDNGNE